jgi:uncharacterized protein YgbK (DUF1537 family)
MGAETSASDLTEQTNPKPPSDVTEALLHQEVRSALARMSDAERFRAVREAVNTGDETIVSVATSASPILSGMSAAEQSAAREKWRQRHVVVRFANIELPVFPTHGFLILLLGCRPSRRP